MSMNYSPCIDQKFLLFKPNLHMPKQKYLKPFCVTGIAMTVGIILILLGNFGALTDTEELKKFSFLTNFLSLMMFELIILFSYIMQLTIVFLLLFILFGILEDKMKNVTLEFNDMILKVQF